MTSNRDNALRFRADLSKWNTKLYGRLDYVLRRTTMLLAQNIIMGGEYGPGTPVDTGFARASWWVQVGSTSRSEGGPVKPQGKVPKGAFGESGAFATALITLAGVRAGGGTVYILNDAAYIVSLEYGHSQQAPQGMVRVVLNAFPQIVAAVASGAAAE